MNPSNDSTILVICDAIGTARHESLDRAFRWAEDYSEFCKPKSKLNLTNCFKPIEYTVYSRIPGK